MRRRKGGPLGSWDPIAVEAAVALAVAVGAVERAKAALVGAVRSGRTPGAPLAEALAGFELGLKEAERAMPGWDIDATRPEWDACSDGLAEARARAERFRLTGRAPGTYEDLIAVIAELMDPLEAFEWRRSKPRRAGSADRSDGSVRAGVAASPCIV
jgi:hypothetical protein